MEPEEFERSGAVFFTDTEEVVGEAIVFEAVTQTVEPVEATQESDVSESE